MKEKVHSNFPNLIFKNIKSYLFLMTFFIGSLNFISSQNVNANDNGSENANENATVYGGEIVFSDGETYNSFCIDGEADYADVILENASGRLKQWVITDEDKNIISLPSNITDVNFDEAG